MTRIEKAAIRVHDFLWENVGDNDDWPISILLDDEIYDEFVDAVNELGDAIEEVKPGSKPWPV